MFLIPSSKKQDVFQLNKTLWLSSCFGELGFSHFSTKICSSVTGRKQEAILGFFPEVNSARISGADQPMKLRRRHYPPPEYMLKQNRKPFRDKSSQTIGIKIRF